MGNDSFFSLVILLILFFVLPSVLKLLGRYTLDSKDAGKKREEPGHVLPGEEPAPYREDFPAHGGYDTYKGPEISNKPIHPKWF
ncbi:conserved hypothetical protein [anaerobic digester metagenome]|uniref:Uncharacterized protein n=1 Tax=anaerobic digester metagenome TaxID=1263854 RepID=A0A485M5J1_9ZZZZ